MTASDYDSFAKAYSAENENGLFNAHYARPAVLAMDALRRAALKPCGARRPRRCSPQNYDETMTNRR